MDIRLHSLIQVYKTFLSDSQNRFSKEQLDVLEEVKSDHTTLTDDTLKNKIKFAFGIPYDTNFEAKEIRFILTEYNEPTRAFVLYRLGKENLVFDENAKNFRLKQSSKIYSLLFFIIAILLILYAAIDYNNIFTGLNIESLLTAVLIFFIVVMSGLPFMTALTSRANAEDLLKLPRTVKKESYKQQIAKMSKDPLVLEDIEAVQQDFKYADDVPHVL